MRHRLNFLVFIFAASACIAAPAQTLTYGTWQVSVEAQGTSVEASTVNESGSRLGLFCLVQVDKCIFYVTTQTTCTPNSTSTILVNADAGALTSSVTCTKLGDSYFNVIQDTTDMNGVISESNSLGIAMPLQGGLFKVLHFNLSGASNAIKSAEQQTSNLAKNLDHTM